MVELLRSLCQLNAVSGDEAAVRDFIIEKIKGHCEYSIDSLGNILAFKKGRLKSKVKLMLDAHMDEVGMIVTSVTDEGFLKFATVGGINTESLMFRRVKIGTVNGVIGGKPIHLIDKDTRKKPPKKESLYIDIGAKDREDALKHVNIGDSIAFVNEFTVTENRVLSKALDDRIGCAILIKLLTEDSDYDFYASFSVQEELGMRGARTATYAIDPDAALVLEATTAADISGVEEEKRVCILGKGPAVSFMDKATMYDKAYFNAAINSGISCQPKKAVAGGNNSGAIHLSRKGVRTLGISTPCRYIHSASCVADINDIENAVSLTEYMLKGICSGNIK